jgi:hypothetical protein
MKIAVMLSEIGPKRHLNFNHPRRNACQTRAEQSHEFLAGETSSDISFKFWMCFKIIQVTTLRQLIPAY